MSSMFVEQGAVHPIRWKKQYVGLEVDQVRQLKQLQEENARLKRLVAELSLDKTMLQNVLSKKL